MRHFLSVALVLSATTLVGSCSNESARRYIAMKKGGTSAPVDSDAKESTLSFARPTAASEGLNEFLTDPEFFWDLSETHLTLNRANGSTAVYDRALAQWGALDAFTDSASYESAYAYQDGSFIGLNAGALDFRIGTGKLFSYDMSTILPAGSRTMGVGPGFFSAAVSDGLVVLRGDAKGASSIKIKGIPEGLLEVAPCVLGCIIWGYDGTNIHTYGEDSVWTRRDLPFSAPEDKELVRLALDLKLDGNGRVVVDQAVVLTSEGELFLSRFQGTGDRVITFEEVRSLTTRHCIGCHSAEGFDQENGLKAFKTKIISRLTLDTSSPQVMPPRSAAKVMSSVDKTVVVSWLKLQTEGVDNEPTPVGPTTPVTEDKSKLLMTGAIATQSEKYCLSCHPAAKFQAFWYNGKSDVLSRVTDGSMPAGRTMTDADKAALLNAVEALN